MRMHRSEFHANLIPPSQVSIKTPKNNNIHIKQSSEQGLKEATDNHKTTVTTHSAVNYQYV